MEKPRTKKNSVERVQHSLAMAHYLIDNGVSFDFVNSCSYEQLIAKYNQTQTDNHNKYMSLNFVNGGLQ